MFILGKHPGGLNLNCLAISPDGGLLASCRSEVKVWDLSRRCEIHTIEKISPGSVSFSPEGQLVVSDNRFAVVVYDPHTGKPLQRFGHSWCRAQCASISPDGRTLVCGGHFHRDGDRVGRVLAWNLKAKTKRVRRLGDDLVGDVFFGCFSPDGRYHLAGGEAKQAWLWDLQSSKLLGNLKFTGKWTRAVAFSPDGQLFAVSAGRNLELWTPEPLQRLGVLCSPRGSIRGVAFTPEGLLVSAGSDGLVRVWNPHTGSEQTCYDWEIGRLNNLAIAPNGQIAAAGASNGKIVVWDLD